jgi:hypothetical protein
MSNVLLNPGLLHVRFPSSLRGLCSVGLGCIEAPSGDGILDLLHHCTDSRLWRDYMSRERLRDA